MKYLRGGLIALVSICCVACYAYPQSIVSKKIVVLKYKDHLDTLELPQVSDKYPALQKALSYKNIFYGDDLPDIIKKYADCECGITAFGYEVPFESKDILSIKIYAESTGAFADETEQWFTLNIATGEPYPLHKEINAKGLKWLFDNYKAELRKRVYEYKIENPDEDAGAYADLKTAIDNLHSDELFNKYVFTNKGVAVSVDKILPHAMQAMEPDRDMLVPYHKLKIYKTPGAVVIK